MNTLLAEIVEISNLYWAWEKAKSCYKPGDTWFNELEVAVFEANLSSELDSIRNDMLLGTYKVAAIEPIPFPKGKNADGPRTRQTFWVKVRDQVAWIAVVNVIGKYLDSKMPFWSYGNRLYITVFKKENETNWSFGHYRNTTKNIFRTWVQSWPMFRRHINITAKLISRKKQSVIDIDELEQSLIDTNESLEIEHPLFVKYISKDYWPDNPEATLFWASIDFEKFYPSVKQQAIKQNIKKHLGKLFDESFGELMEDLFLFPLDYSNWTDEDLTLIQITERIPYYLNIPTGLFVGGFLANVALMEIDEIINTKLENNKAIAHFRYVDDHVILSSSFDEIIKWIEEYKLLLHSMDVGAVFNLSKTNPAPLAQYFETKKKIGGVINPKNMDELKEAEARAKEEMLLDPNFPSPLMTQTLTKVSKLAKTNFQLLTPQEENNLLTDVEHLLLTEFPDEELRKDTRVSFAARMLSTLVPELTTNIDELYRFKKLVCENEFALTQSEEIYNNTAKKSVIESEGNKITQLKESLSGLRITIKSIEKTLKNDEQRLGSRTLKLLVKAVKENHEKVRLWTRLLEFCFKMGIADIVTVIHEVKYLQDKNESNQLSGRFIYSLILQILSNLLMQGVNIIVSENFSHKRKRRSRKFIDGVINEEVFELYERMYAKTTLDFEKKTFDLFKFTAGTAIHLLNEYSGNELENKVHLIKKYQLVDWRKPESVFYKKSSYTFPEWMWWLLNRLPRREYPDLPYLWPSIEKGLKPSNAVALVILQLYPDYLSPETISRLNSSKSIKPVIKNEGFLHDLFRSLSQRDLPRDYKLLKSVEQKMMVENDLITLSDWIDWTANAQLEFEIPYEGQLVFDPRLSEWTALEITSKITKLLISKLEDIPFESVFDKFDYARSIHPNNFLLPDNIIKKNNSLTWEDLKKLLLKADIIMRDKNQLIADERYFITVDQDNGRDIQSAIRGICCLLICLLAKDYRLPAKWNPIGQQLAWIQLYKLKLKNTSISTYTRNMIDGCFSSRNMETRLLKASFFEFSLISSDDTGSDPPAFNDLKELLQYIQLSKKRLERYQISVSEHQPRQLIPINLAIMKRANYQEEQIEEQ